VSGIDLGLDTSALALVGRRNGRFISAWIWHRTHLYDLEAPTPVSGIIDLDDVPAGSWKVTWWDTARGEPSGSRMVEHPGGMMRIPTPPISRHAAVVLSRAQ
jgi:hypothetical protein